MKESKKCYKCGVDKLLTEYYRKKSQKDGYQNHCKTCVNGWQKKHYSRPEIAKKRIERQESDEYRMMQRRGHLKKKYGISIEKYDEMLKTQSYSCYICGTKDTGNKVNKFFHVDHCHVTNKVRRLLCSNCNMAMGLLKENVDTLKNMIRYLQEFKY